MVPLPVVAQIPRRRSRQRLVEHAPELKAVVDATVVLTPGDLGRVPVEVSHREAVMDADVGSLYATEEALDVVGVDPALGLVFLTVIDAVKLLQALQIIVAEVLISMKS